MRVQSEVGVLAFLNDSTGRASDAAFHCIALTREDTAQRRDGRGEDGVRRWRDLLDCLGVALALPSILDLSLTSICLIIDISRAGDVKKPCDRSVDGDDVV